VLYQLAKATIADFYERASAGSRLGARSMCSPLWDCPCDISVIERPRSVAALHADEEVSSLTDRPVLRPVPTRSSDEESTNRHPSRPASHMVQMLRRVHAYPISPSALVRLVR